MFDSLTFNLSLHALLVLRKFSRHNQILKFAQRGLNNKVNKTKEISVNFGL